MDPKMAYSVAGTLILLLLGGNMFFLKKIIDKVDLAYIKAHDATTGLASLANSVAERQKADYATLQGSINSMGGQLRSIQSDVKEMRHIETDVAVIKDRLGVRTQKLPTEDG